MIDPDKDATATDLLKEALSEARELIKLEVAIAKTEVESEVTRMRSAAIAFAVAAFASTVALSMVLFAVAFATRSELEVSVTSAVALGLIGVIGTVMAFRKMPTSILGRTRQRLGADIRELGESAHGT